MPPPFEIMSDPAGQDAREAGRVAADDAVRRSRGRRRPGCGRRRRSRSARWAARPPTRLPATAEFLSVSVPTPALQMPPPWASLATGPPASFPLTVVRSSVSFPQFPIPPPSPRANPHGPPGHGGPTGAATVGVARLPRDDAVPDVTVAPVAPPGCARDEDAAAERDGRVARVDAVPDRDAGDRDRRLARSTGNADREHGPAAADHGRGGGSPRRVSDFAIVIPPANVPGPILIVAPSGAASTAAWIVS